MSFWATAPEAFPRFFENTGRNPEIGVPGGAPGPAHHILFTERHLYDNIQKSYLYTEKASNKFGLSYDDC
jgi:hypothetical protein